MLRSSCRRAFLTLALAFAPVLASAMPAPTAAQIEMLRQLSPEQREALARQYGFTGPTAATVPEEQEPEAEPELLPTPVPTVAPVDAASLARDRDLAWCKREALLDEDAEPADRARAARQMGYASLDEVPLDERCRSVLKEDQERRFSLDPSPVTPFGYEFFRFGTRGAARQDLPVPADYVVGPGDNVQVQLFGKENQEFTLVVSRDGVLNFPGLGPVSVAGLKFDALERLLQQRVAKQMIGVQASITLGRLRSIRVLVLGDVERPGSYTVSALSTITQALYASGGVRGTGSLRQVQLKRDGRLVGTLDMYDLLLGGSTKDDLRLQSGDAVFIPPLGPTATVEGEVVRPAVYELKGETSVGELVAMAGGLTVNAYPQSALLERIGPTRDRTVLDLDLGQAPGKSTRVLGGDRLTIASVLDKLEDVVRIGGHVHRPRFAQWRAGMRITELFPDLGMFKPKADLEYILIRRELRPSREVQLLSTNLRAALAAPGGAEDVELMARDQLFVFGIDAERVLDIRPLLDELQAQARRGSSAQVVSVNGSVRAPGRYPLEPAMRISDLIRAAGQLAESAQVMEAELTRFEVVEGTRRQIEHVDVDLAAILNGNQSLDLQLKPYDTLHIKPVSNWSELEIINIVGEVRFPGRYPVRKGESLQSVVERAGGLTEFAFPAGAVFTRRELQAREQEQLNRLAERLTRDLTSLSLENAQSDQNAGEALRVGQQVAREVRAVRALGRLVIDLDAVLAGEQEIIVKGGDRLVVPRQTQDVTVIGEVQYATSHLYDERASRGDYIERSGGLTVKADKSRVFVVRANGRVDVGGRSNTIQPGDTIIAPLDTERMRPLVFWSTISQIVYQIALTAASAKTVGAF